MFCYFNGFPHNAHVVNPDVGYDHVSCLWGVRLPLLADPPVWCLNLFRNPGDVMAKKYLMLAGLHDQITNTLSTYLC